MCKVNARIKERVKCVRITSLILGIIVTVCVGIYLKIYVKSYDKIYIFPTVANVADIPADWETVPLVDIVVVGEKDDCPQTYEPIFRKIWYGIDISCDCLFAEKKDGWNSEMSRIGGEGSA